MVRAAGISNGEANAAFALLDLANKIGGAAGISLRSVLENRITDTKCRGVKYRIPGNGPVEFCVWQGYFRLRFRGMLQ